MQSGIDELLEKIKEIKLRSKDEEKTQQAEV